jgi:hypothetical protein
MDSKQRVAVAFLCGCLSNSSSQQYSRVYDYSTGVSSPFSIVNNGGNISIYDYSRRCYLTGREPSFFDYGVSHYISVNRVGDNLFSVFDYNSSSYCSVTCNSQSISIYDYSVGRYFSFSIS